MEGKMTVEFYDNNAGSLTKIIVDGQDILEILNEDGIAEINHLVGVLGLGKLLMLSDLYWDEDEDEDWGEDIGL